MAGRQFPTPRKKRCYFLLNILQNQPAKPQNPTENRETMSRSPSVDRRVILTTAQMARIDQLRKEFRQKFAVELNRTQMAQKVITAGFQLLDSEREASNAEVGA